MRTWGPDGPAPAGRDRREKIMWYTIGRLAGRLALWLDRVFDELARGFQDGRESGKAANDA